MTVAVEAPPPPDCSKYVPDELKQDTPHAPAPQIGADDLETLKNWTNFGIAEAGQLNISNRERRAERYIRDYCEAQYREALAEAQRRAKPWYRRIF